jgi:hypothetical protein
VHVGYFKKKTQIRISQQILINTPNLKGSKPIHGKMKLENLSSFGSNDLPFLGLLLFAA